MAEATTTRKAVATAPVTGTRPEGAVNEEDASRKVREMFTEIAPRYDLLNHLLSLQLDRVWRARTALRLRPILQQAGAVVLDLCCGTGDLALALRKEGDAQIVGADFAHTMLARAKEKTKSAPFARNTKSAARKEEEKTGAGCRATTTENRTSAGADGMEFFEADALRLPFRDASFDLVTTAFGFRNLANYEAGLREIQRVLKPGGTLAILEFMEPPDGLLGRLYRWYFRGVLPKIGAWVSGNAAAYSYLPKSVSRFFQPKELAALMAGVGYESVEFQTWTMGAVALHTGRKT
jgi:demethylmenaquinone methyltransferase / 2-methoxy-6-polyprenyl-1,4-benzoquinol methylase